jgi:2-polyprenyl-3-methyl-5-hydroxy-6-metoxy-1,4-benzoquinol methylase
VSAGYAYQRGDDERKMPDNWEMHRCNKCHSIYLNPRPDSESLPSAYCDYLTHKCSKTYEEFYKKDGIVWRLKRGYVGQRFGFNFGNSLKLPWLVKYLPPIRQKLDRFDRHITKKIFPNPGLLLDIGCGNGEFMEFAKKLGWKVEGVEPDPVAFDICRKKGLDVKHGFIDAIDENQINYDVIMMSHVIEHVPNPNLLINKSLEILRPGGMLWLALPNPNSFGAKIFGAAFCALHPPFHFCLHSQKSLENIPNSAGFEHIRIMRRGFHAKAHWRDSERIAGQYNIPIPSAPIRWLVRWSGDFLSVITPSWSEETVIIAFRSTN